MKRIHIVGGGLAGLTLGIGLRQRGVPVTVWEAGRYPRNRVCGEFISGQGQGVLERLGLLPVILESKPRWAETAAFFLPERGTAVRRLPQRAWCISRYVLDFLLAREFQRLGGELLEGRRYMDKDFPEGVVCAAGRRCQGVEDGWRWFGVKAHFEKVSLAADLEVHLQRDGYVGLCRLSEGVVNVCGLFRRAVAGGKLAPLRGAPGSLLEGRMAVAKMVDGSFCSVAGLGLRPQRASTTECRIGDAFSMIAPISGNGMSMAFESAELALPVLVDYCAGRLNWGEVLAVVAEKENGVFGRRLGWAWWFQRGLFWPVLGNVMVRAISGSSWVWGKCFEVTRGRPRIQPQMKAD